MGCNMAIQINHYETPKLFFEELKTNYPTGHYHKSHSGLKWFCLYIKELNLELTWFNKENWNGELNEN